MRSKGHCGWLLPHHRNAKKRKRQTASSLLFVFTLRSNEPGDPNGISATTGLSVPHCLSVHTDKKRKRRTASSLLFVFYAPQQRTGKAQWCNDNCQTISPVLPVGAYRQKEEAANRFLFFIIWMCAAVWNREGPAV